MVALLRNHLPDKVPLFDAAIFADTGDEPQPVYDHLQWLMKNVPFPILIRTAGTLSDDLLHGYDDEHRYASIPAFLTDTPGQPQTMGGRQCTYRYKIAVIRRTIRREFFLLDSHSKVPPNLSAIIYTGLSYEEQNRIMRVHSHALPWQTYRHPLSELHITRTVARAWLRDHVPHAVPRSSCVFCPFHSQVNWRWIKEADPAGWAKAVAVDKALRVNAICQSGYDYKQAYLHRSCVPLDEADLSDPPHKQANAFANECHGTCGL